MAASTFKRYEKKFLITKAQLDGLAETFQEHMCHDQYCYNGKKYTIYNIYYDNHHSDIIRDCTAECTYKEKMRLRSYHANNTVDAKVYLEIKKKENGVGNKRRVKLTLAQANDFTEKGKTPEFGTYLEKQVSKEIQYYLSCNKVKPNCYIQYDRLAFYGKDDSDFRITFDNNVRIRWEDFHFGKTDCDLQLIKKDFFIMEIKILGAMPLWLTKKLSEMEIYSTGFSKYGKAWQKHLSTKDIA